MAAETTEGKRDEAEDASPKAELKKRRIIGWATAGISGLLFFMLQAHDGAVPHGALIGLPLLALCVGGVLFAIGSLRRATEGLPSFFGSTGLSGLDDEPRWMQPRVTFPVAALLFFGLALGGGYAPLPWAFVLGLGALLPSAVRRPGLLTMVVVGLIYLPLMGTYVLWDPWETHYGEVAREIIERDDWISLWWAQEKWFWSKPILIFWSEAIWLSGLGAATAPDAGVFTNEWAIRAPVMVQSLAAVWVVYLTFKRIYSPRAGALAAIVMATCPHFFFLAHQAITDMYLTANLVMAVCMLALAFASDPDEEATRYRLFGFEVSMHHVALGGLIALVLPQALYLVSRNLAFFAWEGFAFQPDEFLFGSAGNDAIPGNPEHATHYPAVGGDPNQPLWFAQPIAQGLYWLLGLVALVFTLRRERRTQALAMVGFYVFCALGLMGKGIPGIALPGLVALFYLVASRRWNVLLDGQLRVAQGIGIVACVGLPWYVAMYMRHGSGFTDRLLVHDHLNRLAQGVHGDKGSIEYFLEQLGFGTFPWVGLIPAAVLAWLWMRGRDAGPRGQAMPAEAEARAAYHQRETMMMLGLWFFSAFTLFSAMITKFHHYIFPAVPPAALMVGLMVDRMWGRRQPSVVAAEGAAAADAADADAAVAPGFSWKVVGTTVLSMLAPAALVAGIGGLVGDLRGAVPEGIEEAEAKEWALDHPMSGVLAYVLVALGAAGLAYAARLAWRAYGETSPSPAKRRADLGLSAAVGAGAVLVAFVGRDLSWVTSARPWGYERLIHLFVYNYERLWPVWFDYRPVLTGFAVTGGLVFIGLMSRYLRPMASRALVGLALLFSAWTVNVYLVDLSPHWGMGEVFELYYEMREGPEEPIVAWQMNWKGENFYTGNRVHAFVDLDNVKIREWIDANPGITAYFVLEYSRLGSFRSLLRGKEVEEITDKRENNKFLMVRVRDL
ncbi:MAG: hypothetical protein CMN30_24550 [Sandaracinus sp.]|nr:hypothetical protein [Sandaracinus sp.]